MFQQVVGGTVQVVGVGSVETVVGGSVHVAAVVGAVQGVDVVAVVAVEAKVGATGALELPTSPRVFCEGYGMRV